MSLSLSVPSYDDISGNDAIKRTDFTTVNGEEIAAWHYDNTRNDLPESALEVRGVVSVGTSTRGFFPLTREITVFEDPDRKQESVSAVRSLLGDSPDLTAITVYEAYEAACLLRVFNAAGEWFVSTNQKLDASKSRWTATKNFREQFQDALMWVYTHSRSQADNPSACPVADCEPLAEFWSSAPEFSSAESVEEWFFSTLDESKGYTFLVRPTVENKNFFVSPPSNTPMLYNVGVFSENGTVLSHSETVPGIPKPNAVGIPAKTTNPDFDILEYLFEQTTSSGISRQGLMVFTADTHFKLVSQEYHYKSNLRENNTIPYQYIVYNMKLQTVPEEEYESYNNRWLDFRDLYEEVWYDDFRRIDSALEDVIWAIGKAYYARHKPRNRDLPNNHQENQRNMQRLHKPEFMLITKLHNDWIASEDPETGRKGYSIFRRHNPNKQSRRRGRYNDVYEYDPDTGMEYHMEALWNAMYQQDPHSVYQMVYRRINYGENWTVYQPENTTTRDRQRDAKTQRQSFGGRRRMVSTTRQQAENN